VQELLETVGLSPEHYNRFPHEFSAGSGSGSASRARSRSAEADRRGRARVGPRRVDPSADDQPARGSPGRVQPHYIFIAHDLGSYATQRPIAVMYLGKLVEVSPAEELYTRPIMPYTKRCSRVPIRIRTFPSSATESCSRATSESDIPASGCRFHPRCRYATKSAARWSLRWWTTETAISQLVTTSERRRRDTPPRSPRAGVAARRRRDALPANTSGESHLCRRKLVPRSG